MKLSLMRKIFELNKKNEFAQIPFDIIVENV